MLLEEKGLLAKVDPETLAQIPAQFNSPDGDWVGVLARENVLAYNPSMIKEDQLPQSLLDLAKPEWKGKIAIAPTDADFLPLVGAVTAIHGKDVALQWLKGLKDNAQIFDDNEGVTAAVDRGAVATGIVNNYYWARLADRGGRGQAPQPDPSLRRSRRGGPDQCLRRCRPQILPQSRRRRSAS